MTDQKINTKAERMANCYTLAGIQMMIRGAERKLGEAEENPWVDAEKGKKFIARQIEKMTIAKLAYNIRVQNGEV